MHVALRERNRQPFGIKALFDRFIQIKANRPVIGRLNPGAHSEVDTAFRQLGNTDKRRRVLQHARLFRQNVLQDRLGFVDAVAIADAGGQIEPAGAFGRVVDDVVAHHLRVRDNHPLIVARRQRRREDMNRLHGAARASALHVVADFERAENNDHHARGEIGERTL